MPEHLTSNLTPLLPGWTYGEIMTYFADRFDEDRTHVAVVLKQVINEIMARHPWKWLHDSSTVTTEANVATSNLEADLLMLDSEYMVNSANCQLAKQRSLSYIRRCQAEQGELVGQPSHFAHMDGVVYWFPTPSAAYTFLYDYTKYQPDSIDEDSVPPLPRHFQHVLISGVEETMRMDDDRLDGATNLARRKFEKQLMDMIWREESGEQVRAEPDMVSPDA